VPAGGALAGSYTANGTTTTWVPLLDQDGSTIGLVNGAQVDSGPVTTYTYDPSGNPTVSGTPNDWPFQYKGMEKEFTDPAPYYYSSADSSIADATAPLSAAGYGWILGFI